jgi:carbon monoxide dehydrogenase subunit G
MKLEQSFEVAAPADKVWQALIDVERVAPCLPGATVTGRADDDTYDGTFSVKIGPTTASYAGKLKLEQVDEAARNATIQANGTDRRGQGGARATITSSLREEGGGTRVEVVTDYQITGRLARFGRGGMIEDIAERLLKEFAQRLQESLVGEDGESAGEAVGPAAGGPSLDGGEAAAPAGGESPSRAAGEAAPPVASKAAPPAADEATPPPEPPRATQPPAEPLQGGSLIASVLWDRARRNPPALIAVLVGLVVVRALVRRRRR